MHGDAFLAAQEDDRDPGPDLPGESEPGVEVIEGGEVSLSGGGEEDVVATDAGLFSIASGVGILTPGDDIGDPEGECAGSQSEFLELRIVQGASAEAGLGREVPFRGAPAEREGSADFPVGGEPELNLLLLVVASDEHLDRGA